MTEVEIKINSYSKDFTPEKKRVYLYSVYDMISKLKSYCEIEIYLIHLAETIGESKNLIFKEFNSMYIDKNKDAANYVVYKFLNSEVKL